MAQPTAIFVDPTVASTGGSGTIGDPYTHATLELIQWVFDNVSRDTTDGNIIYVKQGTPVNSAAAALNFGTWGNPASGAPTVIQGYATTQHDRGKGTWDGGGTTTFSLAKAYFKIRDMILTNTGSNAVISITSGQLIDSCQISSLGSGKGVTVAGAGRVRKSFITDCGSDGVTLQAGSVVDGCFFLNGTNKFAQAIKLDGSNSSARHNLIKVDGASHGIRLSQNYVLACHNSILSGGTTSDTGQGILTDAAVTNGAEGNIVEGFMGPSTDGFEVDLGTSHFLVEFFGNASYNNTTHYDKRDYIWDEDNEELLSSPFAKTGSLPTDFTDSDFWSDLFAYFALNDVGNVRSSSALQGKSKGAVPFNGASGGGTTYVPIPLDD